MRSRTTTTTTAITIAIAAPAAMAGCGDSGIGGPSGGSTAWPQCDYTVLELDRALLDDEQANKTGWPGFVRERLDGLARGAESELIWYGHRSTDLVNASPASGTTNIRISGRLLPGPITYEQTPLNSVELKCVPYPVAAYLPLELRITTDDGALDEVLVGQGTARPNWTPEEDEAPPPGLTNVFPLEFPDEFSGTLTVELVPGALDGWDEWSWGFGAIFGSDEEETSAHGGMSFRMHRREGEGEGVIRLAVIAEWAPHQANDETGVETDAE